MHDRYAGNLHERVTNMEDGLEKELKRKIAGVLDKKNLTRR